MTRKKNPKVGKQPDLFEGADTEGYVSIEDISDEEVVKLPPESFTEEELEYLADDLVLELAENWEKAGWTADEVRDLGLWDALTAEAQAVLAGEPREEKIDALVELVESAWKNVTEFDLDANMDSVVEDLHYYTSENAPLDVAREMHGRRSGNYDPDVLVEDYVADGFSEEQVEEAINTAMEDADNWDFSESDEYYMGSDVLYKLSVGAGQVWVDADVIAPIVADMTEDEIEEAVKRIDRTTSIDLNRELTRYDRGKGKSLKQLLMDGIEIDTDIYHHVDASPDWDKIEEAVKSALEGEEPAGPDKPPPGLDQSRVVYKFKDGAYVYDLLPEELKKEGQAMGHCVGRPGMGYGTAVKRGAIKILSLRTESGRPKFTLEAELANTVRSNKLGIARFKQIKGKSNRLPGWDLHKTGVGTVKADEVLKLTELVNALGLDPEQQHDLQPGYSALRALPAPKTNPPEECGVHGEDCEGGGFCVPYAAENPAADYDVVARGRIIVRVSVGREPGEWSWAVLETEPDGRFVTGVEQSRDRARAAALRTANELMGVRGNPGRGCGFEEHEAVKADDRAWSRLAPVGEQHLDDLGIHLELRNCPHCGSTLARPLPGHVEEEWNPAGGRPSDEVLARALRYLENEFVVRDGRVDGEMIAESLGFYDERYPKPTSDELSYARSFAPEFDDSQWRELLARADHLRTRDGLPRRFKVRGNPAVSKAQARLLGAVAGGREVPGVKMSPAKAREMLRGTKVRGLPERRR